MLQNCKSWFNQEKHLSDRSVKNRILRNLKCTNYKFKAIIQALRLDEVELKQSPKSFCELSVWSLVISFSTF